MNLGISAMQRKKLMIINKNEYLQFLAGLILILCFIGLPIWWTIYKFKDCRKVGHSTLYCVMDIGH